MAKKKTGRPRVHIDWETVDKMCAIQCTGEEIAGVLGIDYDTLQRRIKQEFKMSFTEYYKQKSSKGKMSLRRRQFQMAETNPTMAIWLGKQYLGQTDKLENDTTLKTPQIKIVGVNKNGNKD